MSTLKFWRNMTFGNKYSWDFQDRTRATTRLEVSLGWIIGKACSLGPSIWALTYWTCSASRLGSEVAIVQGFCLG